MRTQSRDFCHWLLYICILAPRQGIQLKFQSKLKQSLPTVAVRQPVWYLMFRKWRLPIEKYMLSKSTQIYFILPYLALPFRKTLTQALPVVFHSSRFATPRIIVQKNAWEGDNCFSTSGILSIRKLLLLPRVAFLCSRHCSLPMQGFHTAVSF